MCRRQEYKYIMGFEISFGIVRINFNQNEYLKPAVSANLHIIIMCLLPLALKFWHDFSPYYRDCPPELREAISSIIFSAPRCSEVPDLLQIKNLFTAKYGKEFIAAASELRPDSGVNRTVKCLFWICKFEL